MTALLRHRPAGRQPQLVGELGGPVGLGAPAA